MSERQNGKPVRIARILAATLMLVAGLLLAAALPAAGQTPPTHAPNLAPAAIGSHAALQLNRPVARVNGAVLTQGDLLREMYAIFPYAKQHKEGFPKSMEADIRRGALKMIEFDELVYQQAKRRHMTVAPERLAKAEKQFRSQFPNDQAFQEFLHMELDGRLAALRTKIARSLLIEDLLKIEVGDKSWVSVAEARAFYAKNSDRFRLPETFSLQTITIMPPVRPSRQQPNPPPPTPQQQKEMYARAQSALGQAQATKTYEEFGILAEKISEDDYRVMMGDHKSVGLNDLPPAILAAVSRMKPGQISGLIQAEDAYTIVRLNTHNFARTQSFDEVRQALRDQLTREKTENLRHELDAKLRKNANIEEL